MSASDNAGLHLHRLPELLETERYHNEFVNKCCELIPEGYDGDESQEAIILRYLKDMDTLGGILARLTSAYR